MHTTPTFVVAAITCALTAGASADILFVRANQTLPTSQQTGATWATAFKDLQAALTVASGGDQIWIAEGTYKPTSGTNRLATFTLKPNVALIGGFAGIETEIVQRDILNHRTILSGDIGGPSPAVNSIHVLSATNISDGSAPELDGLQIEGGNANGSPSLGQSSGSAIFAVDAGLRLSSCIITKNSATNAIISAGSTLSNRSLNMINCLVVHNDGTAISAGGTLRSLLGHSTIAFNTKGITLSGSGIGTSRLLALVAYFNGSGGESEQLSFDGPLGSLLVGTSVIQGWDGVAPSGTTNTSVDPAFRDVDGPDAFAGSSDDRFDLLGGSTGIDRGIPSGLFAVGFSDSLDVDSDGVTSELYPFDITGAPRTVDDPLEPLVGERGDSGAFEYHRKRIVFVDVDATGQNDGDSWQDAFTDLQDAIALLKDPVTGGSGEIWVAEGTYRPTAGSDSTISFEPTIGIDLYGGFAGGELDRSLRDWRAHPTVLSGDLLPEGAADSRHVVLYKGLGTTATILDGFIIRDGQATIAGGPGGGIVIANDASPVIRNCVITECGSPASVGGAGLAILGNGSGGASIVQCAIVGNGSVTSGPGAGVLLSNVSASIHHSIIAGNRSAASGVGAGIHATTTSTNGVAIRNSIIFDNIAGGTQSLQAQVRNVSGGALLTLSASFVEGLVTGIPGTSVINCFGFTDGDLVDPHGADGILGTADDDYRPASCSNLIDSGDATQIPLDLGDLDHDNDHFDPLPIDFLRGLRRVDRPVSDAGIGGGIALDVGMIERTAADLGSPDLNADGAVDAADLALLLGAWNQVDSLQDLDGDCVVGGSDLAILLGQWS